MKAFDPTITPPKILFIDITLECNLRCKHCHLWMTEEDKERSLTTEEKLNLIKQFGKMNPKGHVILVGGEPLLKSEEFFTMSKLCRNLGLLCATNTNSSLISDDILERMVVEGPNFTLLSLDSHIEKLHDYVRGVKGNYKQVTTTLKKLMDIKRKKYPGHHSYFQTNTVIFDDNIDYWEDYIEFAREELKIDAVSFQMLAHTFANHGKKDHFFETHSIKDIPKAHAIIDRIIKKYADDPFVVTTKNDLEWMKIYMESPNHTSEQVCAAHERNLIVDQYGQVKLCFNMHEIANEDLGNVRKSELTELWTSRFTGEIREIMSTCRLNCGMLSCNRKTDFAAKLNLA